MTAAEWLTASQRLAEQRLRLVKLRPDLYRDLRDAALPGSHFEGRIVAKTKSGKVAYELRRPL